MTLTNHDDHPRAALTTTPGMFYCTLKDRGRDDLAACAGGAAGG